MKVLSAGLLVYRPTADGPEFLLVHPGGPFWQNKDDAAWSIPKGLVDEGEDLHAAALREFAEETGQVVSAPGVALAPCRMPGGKVVHAWLVAGDFDTTTFTSNTFDLEWPPRSGRIVAFPEVDRAAYFDPATAMVKVHRGLQSVVEQAIALLR